MSRIYFEDLPSTNTPRNATNLNKLNNVVISSTEPNTGEEVWMQRGKNLFDGYFEIGGYDINTGQKVNDTSSYRSTNASYVVPNKNYVFSINSQAISINTRYLFYDNNGDLLSTTTSANGSITTPANCYQLRWHSSGLKTNYPNGLTNAMIEQNSTATTYEAYIDKKIYTKNSNDVYELFYGETSSNIESGSNNNGSYVKYPDGTMICYATFNQNFNKASSLWGSLYEYNLASSVSFAETFVEGPVVTAVVSAGSGGGAAFIETITFTKTQITNLILARPTQYTSGSTGKFYISYTAIGKWK